MVHLSQLSRTLASLVLVLAWAGPAVGQEVLQDHEWCEDDRSDSRAERYCEVRGFQLDARDLIRVDAEPNGGIRVEAWDGNEISLLVKVQAWSRRGDPHAIVSRIEIDTGGTISADGPDLERREGWSASYRLMVPRTSDLDLESLNGGIAILGVEGRMEFSTMNGGITLEDVGGDVRGRTTNGGINVALSGDQWQGEGLDLETTNGGVNLTLPQGFRADLTTGTVNGSFHTDFPLTVRGSLRSQRLSTELNGGGPPIRVSTTNGGVRIRSR